MHQFVSKIIRKPFLKALKRSRNQKVVMRKRAMTSHGCHQAFEQENRKKRSSPGPRSRGNVQKLLIDVFKLESNMFFAGDRGSLNKLALKRLLLPEGPPEPKGDGRVLRTPSRHFAGWLK